MALDVSPAVRLKLRIRQGVDIAEVEQCIRNRRSGLLLDSRQRHRTVPPTLWFISTTDAGRLLKVVVVAHDRGYTLKTAFEPNADEIRVYSRARQR